jgi:steroid 5-alpha reductase family enzyme
MSILLVHTLLTIAFAIFVYVNLWWIVSKIVKRVDVADIAWGLGIALVGMLSFAMTVPPTQTMHLLAGLVFVWSLRLALRIFKKNARTSEDARYAQWRQDWGAWFPVRSYVQVFILQGLLMVVVGYPFIHTSVYGSTGLGGIAVLGLVLWCVGFYFETVGDRQLDQFLADPTNKGKLMMTGLWRYSRHPNYFGEVAMWWGIGLIALGATSSIWVLVSPVVVTFLLVRVSGIPMLEAHLANHPDFPAYKARTSPLIPLPPRA